jgi:drug/metabolite transporter (DMT)-like permease
MLVIFGGGVSPDTGAAVGEAMGLAGGVAWALAMLGLHRSEPSPVFEAVFVHFLFLGPVFFLVTLVPGGGATAGPDLELPGLALAWLLALGLLWMLPVVWLTVYGASAVEPGRFAILLMFEIVVGLSSAALLTDEPIGARELAGAVLVLGAIGVEIRAPLRPTNGGR